MADSSPNADTVRIRIFRSRIFNVMQLIRYWPNPSNANFLNPLRVWGCRHYTRLTLKFVCILAPLCLLVFPLLPNITQFETHFYNVHNLTIINHGFATPNVTKIGWGVLSACYHSDLFKKDQCIHSDIASPYAFTVSENSNEIHATVQKTWINTMFIHYCCFIHTLITWITVISVAALRPARWECCTERMCCVGLVFLQVLLGFLMAFTAVTVIADFYIFRIITNRMESFAKGGPSMVITKSTCYAFTVWGCTHIFILCGLTSISLLKDIYTYDHYLTKVADNQDKRAVIQKQIKELQAHRDNITRDRFVQYAVNNNWPGIEN